MPNKIEGTFITGQPSTIEYLKIINKTCKFIIKEIDSNSLFIKEGDLRLVYKILEKWNKGIGPDE